MIFNDSCGGGGADDFDFRVTPNPIIVTIKVFKKYLNTTLHFNTSKHLIKGMFR